MSRTPILTFVNCVSRNMSGDIPPDMSRKKAKTAFHTSPAGPLASAGHLGFLGDPNTGAAGGVAGGLEEALRDQALKDAVEGQKRSDAIAADLQCQIRALKMKTKLWKGNQNMMAMFADIKNKSSYRDDEMDPEKVSQAYDWLLQNPITYTDHLDKSFSVTIKSLVSTNIRKRDGTYPYLRLTLNLRAYAAGETAAKYTFLGLNSEEIVNLDKYQGEELEICIKRVGQTFPEDIPVSVQVKPLHDNSTVKKTYSANDAGELRDMHEGDELLVYSRQDTEFGPSYHRLYATLDFGFSGGIEILQRTDFCPFPVRSFIPGVTKHA